MSVRAIGYYGAMPQDASNKRLPRRRAGISQRWSIAILVVALLPARASAHPEGFSGLQVQVRADRVHASLTVHTRDMSQWFPPRQFPDYVAGVCAAMEREPGLVVEVRINEVPVRPTMAKASYPEVGLIQFELEYPLAAEATNLEVWSRHLRRLPSGHQQLMSIRDMRRGPPDGVVLLDVALTSDADAGYVELARVGPAATSPATVPTTNTAPAAPVASDGERPRGVQREGDSRTVSFFVLGVEHILTGYDHLLFLAGLLLVCTRFRDAASIITCFTIAHSITLALASLDIVHLPGEIVEPAIAASIIYVGIENLIGRHRLAWRMLVTFGFGLVHGLGFASVLREIGLGRLPGGIAMPLLKFNLGVEAGQLAVAAVILPLLLLMRRKAWFRTWGVAAASGLVIAAGSFWLIERVIGILAGAS